VAQALVVDEDYDLIDPCTSELGGWKAEGEFEYFVFIDSFLKSDFHTGVRNHFSGGRNFDSDCNRHPFNFASEICD